MTGQEFSRTKTFFKDTKRESYQVLTGETGRGHDDEFIVSYPYRRRAWKWRVEFGGGGGRVEKKERLPIESCSSGGEMSKYATSRKNKENFIELGHEWGVFFFEGEKERGGGGKR